MSITKYAHAHLPVVCLRLKCILVVAYIKFNHVFAVDGDITLYLIHLLVILINDFTCYTSVSIVEGNLTRMILLARFLSPATGYATRVQGFTSVNAGPFSQAINFTTWEDRKFWFIVTSKCG